LAYAAGRSSGSAAVVAEVNRLDAEQLPSVLDHLDQSAPWRALNVLAIAERTARPRYMARRCRRGH
jgi:hypothetical protein